MPECIRGPANFARAPESTLGGLIRWRLPALGSLRPFRHLVVHHFIDHAIGLILHGARHDRGIYAMSPRYVGERLPRKLLHKLLLGNSHRRGDHTHPAHARARASHLLAGAPTEGAGTHRSLETIALFAARASERA